MLNKPNPFPGKTSTSEIVASGTNKTHAILILDGSGSMGPFVSDTIGGVNSFIQKQAQDNDGTKITVIKFDSPTIDTIIDNQLASNDLRIDGRDYWAGGGTNLLDAIGLTINKINNDLNSMAQEDRPNIILQIMTDGEENSSKKYNYDGIKTLIQECEKQDWMITFVGANIDSIKVAGGLGINAAGVSNYTTAKTETTFNTIASSVTRMKSMRGLGMDNSQIYASGFVYTADEKKEII